MKHAHIELIISQLKEYLENIEYFYLDYNTTKDNEALHQLRVNVRKSRTILKAFHYLFNQERLDRIYKKLSKIGNISNPIRDLDVFLDKDGRSSTLNNHLIYMRKKEQKKLELFLKSDFIIDMIKEYKKFLETVEIDKLKKAKPFIKVLKKYFNRMELLYSEYLETKEKEKLHKIRINLKKIRYLLEPFNENILASKYQSIMTESKTLQTILGDFHDLVMQQLLLKNYLSTKSDEDKKTSLSLLQENQKEQEYLKMKIEPLLETFIEGL